MLEVLRLDDLDYQRMMERARARVPELSAEWTDLNEHDPGITTLEVFAWLCDSLNYYADAMGEAHRRKLLKLLGIIPRNTPARCHVMVSAPEGTVAQLPCGTRMAAGEIVFELAEPLAETANELLRLYSGEEGKLQDLTEYTQGGGFAPVFEELTNGGSYFWLGFLRPLAGRARFYLEVEENGRNPFSDGFSLVNPVWEAFDGERWSKAQIVFDETCGLLRSGFLTLQLKTSTGRLNAEGFYPAHYLRCSVREGAYDMPPKIGRVATGCAVAVQQDTLVYAQKYIHNGTKTLPIDRAVGPDDLITVAVWQNEAWQIWYCRYPAQDDMCTVEQDKTPDRRVIRFSSHRLKAGTRILVVIERAGVEDQLVLGVTDGCAESKFALNIPEKEHICALTLALCGTGQDGRRVMWLYDACDEISSANYNDAVFWLDRRGSRVVFGDGIHAIQPQADLEVRIVTLQYSRLDGGNILKNRVNRLMGIHQELSVQNLDNAEGGVQRSNSEELEEELAERLQKVRRAVTADDIRLLALDTPGLLLDHAAVLSDPADPGIVRVAVKPRFNRPRPIFPELYAQLIQEHLSQCRLLCTNLQVVPARYVGIEVYGRIVLHEKTPAGRKRVLDVLESCLDGIKDGLFGLRVDIGRLLSALEVLPEVRAVTQLTLECSGQGGQKDAGGDIILRWDCLSYLQGTDIDFR